MSYVFIGQARILSSIDNQASLNYISATCASHLGLETTGPHSNVLLSDSSTVVSKGKVTLEFHACHELYVQVFEVLPDCVNSLILGRPFLVARASQTLRHAIDHETSLCAGVVTTLRYQGRRRTIAAVADLGASCGIVSLNLLRQIGITISSLKGQDAERWLGTGKSYKHLGFIKLSYQFEGPAHALGKLRSYFCVVRRCPFDLAFGRDIIERFSMLTTYRRVFHWRATGQPHPIFLGDGGVGINTGKP